ncbi:hypothetical protein B7P43_G07195 [Cryptotermes secundus]|uniref:Dynein axonemal assembly factor 1 homolog n=2 Tax=Cryptotermes secundus TaxID=105785 RepID=A0A2J7PJS6_9NEOP|nr:hypothetical protein B7P43_G07195 [Cryptotermes secundus]
MMTSLVKLHLGNNMIEKIEGLSFLANLKELDLSFNNIEIIENLEVLVKLEVLTLFENRISKLENMETLVNLMIFSIGNNQIEDRNDVIYLRQFSHLYSLNMAGNPCVCNGNRDFRVYICAFLPKLTYYEYRIISAEERAIAEGSYKDILQQLEETEEKKRQTREDAEARTMELARHTEAFVENLDGDQLFSAMFTNDTDSKALFTMGDVATDVYNKFHDEAMNVIRQLFKVGLEQHEIRQEEIRQYYQCVDAAKEMNTVSCQQYTENFLERKAEIFLKIRNILKSIQDLLDMEESAAQVEYVARVQILSDQFNKECQTAWYELMAQELTLYEQLEEVNGSFQQNMTNLVSAFIKAAQSFFVQIRNLEASYSEELSEVAHAYLTNLNAGTVLAVPELKQIMLNKESLNSAITQSHDTHIQTIDSREDELVTRIRKWVESYCDQIAT